MLLLACANTQHDTFYEYNTNMNPVEVLIGMGANLGNPEITFKRAQLLLSSDLINSKISPLYQTIPVYDKPGSIKPNVPQPMYTNAVMHAYTYWSPQDLLKRLLEVEKTLGRIRPAPVCSPRHIDLDLLLYGDCIISSTNPDELQLPHPRMHLREFVLIPAADIAPDMVHPGLNKTIKELLEQLSAP